jgi:hypothetical protein
VNSDSNTRAAVVYTHETIAEIAKEGGTQDWKMDAKHIGAFDYVIAARSRTASGDPHDVRPVKSAFMIGKVADIVPATKVNGPRHNDDRRWLIRLSEVAQINIPNFWNFGRWPMRIGTLAEFGVDPADYAFRPLSDFLDGDAKAAGPDPDLAERARRSVSEIIAEHRTGIAREVGVAEDRIDITIRF